MLLTGGRTTACLVDGFTLASGRANGTGTVSYSGNAYDRSKAGEIYNSTGSPTIANCIISNNIATGSGGGMYNATASPVIISCAFRANTAGSKMVSYGGVL